MSTATTRQTERGWEFLEDGETITAAHFYWNDSANTWTIAPAMFLGFKVGGFLNRTFFAKRIDETEKTFKSLDTRIQDLLSTTFEDIGDRRLRDAIIETVNVLKLINDKIK